MSEYQLLTDLVDSNIHARQLITEKGPIEHHANNARYNYPKSDLVPLDSKEPLISQLLTV